jgi:fumarylacetoacetase
MLSRRLNETHDPELKSWVESANAPGTDFPIQNLPFGVFARRGRDAAPRLGVAIGDQILDVSAALREELFDGLAVIAAEACASPSLNDLLALGREYWLALRRQISALLGRDSPAPQSDPRLGERILVPMAEAELRLPVAIGDYTDFYASVYHATNVGRMMRPDSPLFPNYKYVPIGYYGRASSVVVSGMPVRRPKGQAKRDDAEEPSFGPSRRLDYELEVACVIGPGNALGDSIPLAEAEDHIFGVCLLNDWSARDLQRWEYQPLGPFLAKSFATTISPWVVTMEALAPFRCPAFARPEGDPRPLPYLDSPDDQARGGIDLTLEVYLRSQPMRDRGLPPMRLSRGNFRDMYWTLAQMVTHHASNGCNLRPGDLMASGTVSGEAKESRGCLLELTWGGKEPIELPSGETRRFLEDGDEVILRGYCEREGYARIGFGECRGEVLAAQ